MKTFRDLMNLVETQEAWDGMLCHGHAGRSWGEPECENHATHLDNHNRPVCDDCENLTATPHREVWHGLTCVGKVGHRFGDPECESGATHLDQRNRPVCDNCG